MAINMMQANNFNKKIQEIKEANLYRSLIDSDVINAVILRRDGKKFISFASNDYFGLSQNSAVKKAAIAAIKKYGVGSGASRYVTGNNSLYKKLEKEIAEFKNCEDAIVFSSGYACAIGVIPALVSDGDLIVADKLIHSSLIDGSRLSSAKLMRFAHNDLEHARKILEENRGSFKKCLIITETVFSMDGDLGEVGGLGELAAEFECMLLTDDAHGLWYDKNVSAIAQAGFVTPPGYLLNAATKHKHADGVTNPVRAFGKVSNLITDCWRVTNSARAYVDKSRSCPNYIQLGTLSKAIGSFGGYVVADVSTIDYLRNFAKSQIYSTALPPAVLAAALESLKIIKKKNPAKKTLENATYFCELMNLPQPQSAIIPIIIGDAKKTLEIAAAILAKGFIISAIRPPTVETGKSRLRITFSSKHKKSQIKKLAEILSSKINESANK